MIRLRFALGLFISHKKKLVDSVMRCEKGTHLGRLNLQLESSDQRLMVFIGIILRNVVMALRLVTEKQNANAAKNTHPSAILFRL